MGGRTAGWQGKGAIGQRLRKYLPVVGDVRPYRGTYQGGTGVQRGAGNMVRFGTYNIRSGRKGDIQINTFWAGSVTD